MGETAVDADALVVRVEHSLCTGDGLCAEYAPEVFELDVDGIAYVKTAAGELVADSATAVPVPVHLALDVIDSAKECPGECIHVTRASDGSSVAGPDAG